jgi:polysaccharide export outer membrane protein
VDDWGEEQMNHVKSLRSGTSVVLGLLCATLGCAPRATVAQPGMNGAGGTVAAVPAGDNAQRLARLHSQRQAGRSDGDYVVGKGDLLSLNAFDFTELNQKVRVDGNGAVTLPLLGTMSVAGRTVAEVQQDLTQRLGNFMFDPHVSVFVEEYRGQQVAVLGAVLKPGMVSHTTRNATVLDTISAAGGMTPDAGSRIFFMPVENRGQGDPQAVATVLAKATPGTLDGSVLGDTGAVVVDTKELDQQTQRFLFDLPVRDGDVVVVPAAGNFFASGWFERPGTYPLRSGLTVRGAIATAGGFSYPAKRTQVRIYRPGANGQTEMREVNYKDIESLKTPDIYLHEGDVLEVSASAVKVVPWGVYHFFTKIIGLGFGVKAPI